MRFIPNHPWALTPIQAQVDIESAKERQRLYREHFRFVRAERQPEFCAPWVLGQKAGWRILSPVDIDLDALPQREVDGVDAAASSAAAAQQELWLRSGTALIMDRPPWLHLYQFRENDAWGNMFIPNGQGSLEWRQGWSLDAEGGTIMVFPSEESPTLGVHVGVFTPAVSARMKDAGFSIAFTPVMPLSIRRGQEIARIVAIAPEALKTV